MRGTTDRTGDQEVHFDDVSLEVIGHEQPRRDAVVLGDAALGLTGVYHPDGRIAFDEKPVKEWEFMATGTGVTGLTVSFPDEMVMQVNHSASIDESGQLRALARLHLDFGGRPFARATNFRMEHDLRRSVIRAFSETSNGPVRVEIRAHVPDDIIRVDIFDERKTLESLTIRLAEDAPSSVTVAGDGGVCLWHDNPAGTVAPIKRASAAHAAAVQADNRPWLAGRTFGLAIAANGAAPAVAERTLTFPAAARHSLLLAGVSTLGGRDTCTTTAAGRLRKALGDVARSVLWPPTRPGGAISWRVPPLSQTTSPALCCVRKPRSISIVTIWLAAPACAVKPPCAFRSTSSATTSATTPG